jgi:murein L,D-transpeptidase YcbB/YkuD
VFTDKIMVNVRQRIKDGISPTPVPPTPPTPPTPTPDYPDTPFLIKVKAPVDIYADSKGKKKTGKKVDKVGVYTIVECNEPDGFGKLKSGAGWVDLKDENIYIRGEGGDEMKFSELKEMYYKKSNVMKGDAVEIVQAAVNPVDGIDGSFGPNTEAAVKSFQKSKGIVADGIVGEETWRQIWNLCKKDQ